MFGSVATRKNMKVGSQELYKATLMTYGRGLHVFSVTFGPDHVQGGREA